jgi:hypothetical protein
MTNNLANDMTRLCGEIAAWRDGRARLMGSLAETRAETRIAVNQMLQGFAAARSEIAAQSTAELGGFVSRVKEAVTDLRQTVAGLQEQFREDLAGADRAWHGADTGTRPSPTAAKSSFRSGEPSDETTPRSKRKKRQPVG